MSRQGSPCRRPASARTATACAGDPSDRGRLSGCTDRTGGIDRPVCRCRAEGAGRGSHDPAPPRRVVRRRAGRMRLRRSLGRRAPRGDAAGESRRRRERSRAGIGGVSVNWQTTGLQNPDWGFESLHPCSRSRRRGAAVRHSRPARRVARAGELVALGGPPSVCLWSGLLLIPGGRAMRRERELWPSKR